MYNHGSKNSYHTKLQIFQVPYTQTNFVQADDQQNGFLPGKAVPSKKSNLGQASELAQKWAELAKDPVRLVNSIKRQGTVLPHLKQCEVFIKVHDLNGSTVLPGLQDAHLHIAILGERAERINLSHCHSISEIQQVLCDALRSLKQGMWCIGYDWDHEKLEERRPPTRSELDAVSIDHPIFIFRVCVHVGVGNTQALKTCNVPTERPVSLLPHLPAGLCPPSEDAAQYLVGYDEVTGSATGILRESMCYNVEEVLRKNATFEQRFTRIQRGIHACLRVGLTAVQPNDARAWDVYTELHKKGNLPIRVHLTVPYAELGTEYAPEHPYCSLDDMFRCQRVKVSFFSS